MKIKRGTKMLHDGNIVYVDRDKENGEVLICDCILGAPAGFYRCVGIDTLFPIKKITTGLKSASIAKSKPVSTKPKKPIPKISDKQAKLNAAYKVLRDAFMSNHKYCEGRLEGCTGLATECHHGRGRGVYFLDDSTYIALCQSCHQYLETHPKFAKEIGLSASRLEKREG